MKKAILAIMLTMAVMAFLIPAANADQRFESHQGICHFAYDENDDDNEVYFANCENVIDTYDDGRGGGRLAAGTSRISMDYSSADKTIIRELSRNDIFIKGADASNLIYPDSLYTTAANTPCVMVTSNYDANNDDDNETVYVTNDYNLQVRLREETDTEVTEFITEDGAESTRIVTIYTVDYSLACRGGVAQ